MKKVILISIFSLLINLLHAQMAPPPPPFYLPTMTAQQLEQIKAAEIKNFDKIKVLHDQLFEKKEKLRSLLKESELNKKETTKMVEEIGKINADILLQAITFDLEIKSCLNESQKVIFDATPKPFLF